MTEKQRLARLANLQTAREKRMQNIKLMKEQESKQDGYDISSDENEDDESSSSDSEAFIISKKKPVNKKPTKPIKSKKRANDKTIQYANINEFNELRNIVIELAKKNKRKKAKTQPVGTTKIINVMPPQQQQTQGGGTERAPPTKYYDNTMEQLMRSVMS